MKHFFAALALVVAVVAPLSAGEYDIVIYGGTSGGVAAAVQAARLGKRVALVEPGKHLGGMTAGGLSAVDIGDPRTVGGLAREFFTRLVAKYGKQLAWNRPFDAQAGGPATGGAYSIEPHTAEQLFGELIREAKVPLFLGARLATLRKAGPRITEIGTEDGSVFRAKVFVDTTYEGDLLAKAGVSYTLLREGNAKYGETYNGIHYAPNFAPRLGHKQPGSNGRVRGGQGVWDRDWPLDPYVVPGDPASGLLPLVDAGEPGTPGAAAPGVQAYCYRLCLSTRADRLPIEPPADYDPKRYELVARFIAACLANGDDMDLRWFAKHDPLPNDKWDFNTATFGGNLPGASWQWPDASYARREQIDKEHENYHRGLLHFLATDPRVPEKVRQDMRRFGLARDEFTDNGGWPHQIYVREARRMVSDLVLTEHHTFGRQVAVRSIGLGSYGTDTHEVRRIVKDGVVTREGKTAGGRGGFGPYQIGYGAIVPKATECDNLLVTFALSASHTAFSSIRMEPVFMVTSQSAATAACQAIDANCGVQQVDYDRLRTKLLADGQVLEWQQPAKASKAQARPRRHLFLDPDVLEDSQNASLRVNPPQQRELVIRADKPWEELMISFFLTVLEEEGRLRMWYICRDRANRPNVAYAESTDGLHWNKPNLGIVEYDGSKENNLVGLSSLEGTVFRDSRVAPAERYAYVTHVFGDGIVRFHSPDGLHWTRDARMLSDLGADTQISSFWDERIGQYALYMRGWSRRADKKLYRKVVRAATRNWSEPLPIARSEKSLYLWGKEKPPVIGDELPTVLATDDRDPPNSDVYNISAQPYPLDPSWYVGFPSFFQREKNTSDGRLEIDFVGSRDGVAWHRYDRRPYVSPGLADSASANMVYMGVGMVPRGDEIWQYGTGFWSRHGDFAARKQKTDGAIYRYVQRVDGFVSLDFDLAPGRARTQRVRVDGPALVLNVDTAALGQLRVAVLDSAGKPIAGRSVDECDGLHINSTHAKVSWRGRHDLSELAGREVKLEFSGSRAKLYGFYFDELPGDRE